MAAILIMQHQQTLELSLHQFRSEEDKERFIASQTDKANVLLELNEIARNAVNQIERHFKRMWSLDYILTLKNNPQDLQKLIQLYEIGARR